MTDLPRRFHLQRDTDVTGISGTGRVADGIQFVNEKIAISWRSEHTSVAIYDTMKDVEAIHGHQGMTKIVWDD